MFGERTAAEAVGRRLVSVVAFRNGDGLGRGREVEGGAGRRRGASARRYKRQGEEAAAAAAAASRRGGDEIPSHDDQDLLFRAYGARYWSANAHPSVSGPRPNSDFLFYIHLKEYKIKQGKPYAPLVASNCRQNPQAIPRIASNGPAH